MNWKLFLLIPSVATCFLSCGNNEDKADTSLPVMSGTPVTLTHIDKGTMKETVELNATSTFQLKFYIKANATGYLESVNAKLGGYISKGREIFVIRTKEAKALDNTINALDSSFQFKGTLHIKSPGNGFVTQLNYKIGDYVQDGEQLATISDRNSFVFLLNLPYELSPYLSMNKNLQLRLPDSTMLNGHIVSSMPTVDAASQTQSIVIRVDTNRTIPEGLIAKVLFIKKSKPEVTTLPKDAVLTNDIQDEFWVMKLIDDSTAVKIPVKKGMENDNEVEILSPEFSAKDQILLTGNYGLPDTAKVIVTNRRQ